MGKGYTVYSVRELVAILQGLLEDGYKTIDFLELLELIGWQKEDIRLFCHEYEIDC